jgi:nitroreductase
MEIYDAMRTAFAAREFTADPVSDATLYRILDNARFAPSGGNRQGWRVIVIRDSTTRAKLAELSIPTARRYVASVQAGENPFNTIVPSKVDEAAIARTVVPATLLDWVRNAPVILLVAVDLRFVASFDSALPRVGVISGASIYPFAWNIILAARNEGLGGVLTTMVAPAEADMRRHLKLPDYFAIAAVIPIGKPVKQLKKLKRKPVSDFATLESFSGAPLLDSKP